MTQPKRRSGERPKTLTCEGCEQNSFSHVVIHGLITFEGGATQGHIYANGWVGECEGVDTCPDCSGKVKIDFRKESP